MFSHPLILAYVLGAQKNSLIETVILSTHNINMFWMRNLDAWLYCISPGSTLLAEFKKIFWDRNKSEFTNSPVTPFNNIMDNPMHFAFICNSVWENLSEYKGLNIISQNSEKIQYFR